MSEKAEKAPIVPGEKLALPSGAWVTFRDPATVSYLERREMDKVQAAVGARARTAREVAERTGQVDFEIDADQVAEVALRVREQAARVFVDEWSYDCPIPRQGDRWQEVLPAIDWETIENACDELVATLYVDARPTKDPEAPTSPLSE